MPGIIRSIRGIIRGRSAALDMADTVIMQGLTESNASITVTQTASVLALQIGERSFDLPVAGITPASKIFADISAITMPDGYGLRKLTPGNGIVTVKMQCPLLALFASFSITIPLKVYQ